MHRRRFFFGRSPGPSRSIGTKLCATSTQNGNCATFCMRGRCPVFCMERLEETRDSAVLFLRYSAAPAANNVAAGVAGRSQAAFSADHRRRIRGGLVEFKRMAIVSRTTRRNSVCLRGLRHSPAGHAAPARSGVPEGSSVGTLALVRIIPVVCLILACLRLCAAPLNLSIPRWPAMWYEYATSTVSLAPRMFLAELEGYPGPATRNCPIRPPSFAFRRLESITLP